MTPAEIGLARRIVACGLPVPTVGVDDDGITVKWDTVPPDDSGFFSRQWMCEPEIGDTVRPFGIAPSAGILFVCVATDAGPELLPALDDYALLGWLITELERVTKSGCDIFEVTEAPLDMVAVLLGTSTTKIGKTVCWSVSTGGPDCHDGDTRIEALVAALEAAKAAK